MMTNRRILTYVNAEPFRPFRINLASGKVYDIPHPEMIAVGKTTVHVFTGVSDEDEEEREREQELSLILIESVEPIDSSVSY